MSDELEEQLKQNSQKPAKAEGDAGSVEQHPLRDQIELDRYLNSKKATKRRGLGVKISKLIPPGPE